MIKDYAGIGSRDTPPEICKVMTKIAQTLSGYFRLRSGGALGADRAFEDGAKDSLIFHPKKVTPSRKAFELAESFHPAWDKCSKHAKLLHARNGYIILGEDLESPVAFVLYWTKAPKNRGGTRQGLRIAKAYQIPTFDVEEKLQKWGSPEKIAHVLINKFSPQEKWIF